MAEIENDMIFFEENTYDVVFSFDTTGSMSSCINEVKKNLTNLIKRLFTDIPNLRIGVIAHGDYGDEGKASSYLMKQVDLTDNKQKLIDFIQNVGSTHGYDFEEAYEYVLHKSQELTWESDKRILVMIGDATPHEKINNKYNLDWRVETKKLFDMNVNVYGVQCMHNAKSNNFYKSLAKISDGYYLELEVFSSIEDLIMTVCYKQVDDEEVLKYEKEMEDQGRMTKGMRKVVDVVLRRENINVDYDYINVGEDTVAKPCWDSAKFQVLDVDVDCNIKSLLNNKKMCFGSGISYYEIIKPTLVTNDQNIILMNKDSENIYEGNEAKKILKFKKTYAKKQKLQVKHGYRTFIKCANHITRLGSNTKVLYEEDGLIVI